MTDAMGAGNAGNPVALFEVVRRTYLLDNFQGIAHAYHFNVVCLRLDEGAELLGVALIVDFKAQVLFGCRCTKDSTKCLHALGDVILALGKDAVLAQLDAQDSPIVARTRKEGDTGGIGTPTRQGIEHCQHRLSNRGPIIVRLIEKTDDAAHATFLASGSWIC